MVRYPSMSLTDIPPSVVLSGESCNRTGKHKETEVVAALIHFQALLGPFWAFMTTLGLLQFTHVHGIKEIHHIDDYGVGGLRTKVSFATFICKYYSQLCQRLIPRRVFQENISKAPRVQRYDDSTWSCSCSVVRVYT